MPCGFAYDRVDSVSALVLTPLFVPPLADWLWHRADWTPLVPVNLLLSVLLAGLTAFLYGQTLEPMGRLLHRRELKILNIVTAEQE